MTAARYAAEDSDGDKTALRPMRGFTKPAFAISKHSAGRFRRVGCASPAARIYAFAITHHPLAATASFPQLLNRRQYSCHHFDESLYLLAARRRAFSHIAIFRLLDTTAPGLRDRNSTRLAPSRLYLTTYRKAPIAARARAMLRLRQERKQDGASQFQL